MQGAQLVALPVKGGVAVLALVMGLSSCAGTVVADPAKLRVVEQRLQPVLQDLRDLSTPPGLRPVGEPEISGCSGDSGSALQPTASREWRRVDTPSRAINGDEDQPIDASPEARRAAEAVADDLVRLGWKREREMTPAGQISLSKDAPGYRIEGTVSASVDFVSGGSEIVDVSAAVDGPAPCTLE